MTPVLLSGTGNKAAVPFPSRMPLLSPTSKGVSERGCGGCTEPQAGQSWATALPWWGLCCCFGQVTPFLWTSPVRGRLEQNIPETLSGFKSIALGLNLGVIHDPEETGGRNCLHRGLLWVKTTGNWKTKRPPQWNPLPSGCVQTPWQTGQRTESLLLSVVLRIDKADRGI